MAPAPAIEPDEKSIPASTKSNFMKPAVLRQTLRVDASHQLHINVPIEMGDEIEVTVRPANQPGHKNSIIGDEQFLIATYSAATPEDAKEDAIWEKYLRA